MHDSTEVYVVVEAAITGDVDDVTRCDRRRNLMERISGAPCLAAIVAETLREPVARALRRDPAEEEKPERDTVASDSFNALARVPISQDVHVLYLETRHNS